MIKNIVFNYWAIFLIFLIWLLFSHPFFIHDLVPFPATYLVDDFAPWSAYPEFAGPVKNGAMPDVIGQIFPWKMLVIESWKTGQIPLWNQYSFSGTPLLANYQSAALSPLNLLYFVFSFIDAWSIQVLLQPLLAGIFMYIYTQSLKLSKQASLISSIAFMFCGFITTWMAYGTLAYAILFLPLALFSIEKYVPNGKLIYLLILSATFPLSFYSGHFQMSIYFAALIFIYLAFRYFFFENKKQTLLLGTASISGLLLTMPQVIPSMEFYFESVRSELFLKLENIPWGYLPTLIAPDFYGNPVTRNDWFGHYAEWNMYIGTLPLFLGIYAASKFNKFVIFYLSIAIVTILLSFQSPLLDLIVSLKLPVISTSAASRIVVIFSFAFAILAGFGFERLISDIKEKKYRNISILFFCFAIAFSTLLLIVMSKMLIPLDKNQIALSNLKLPILIFLIFSTFLIAIRLVRFKFNIKILTLVVILLVGFDLFRFAVKWMPFDTRDLVYPEVPVVEFAKLLPEDYRGLGNYGAEAAVNFRLPYLEGYDPLYIRRYGEFIASVDDGNFHNPGRSVVTFPKMGEHSDKIINMLGVKYILHKISDGRQPWAFPFWEYPIDQYVKIYEDQGYEIYQNQRVHERALLIPGYEVIKGEKEILKKLYSDETDLKKMAIIEKDIEINNLATGTATLISYNPNNIEIKTDAKGPSILFLADPYYPGWKAYINGSKTEVLRANYAFRGVVVPEGENKVRFVYEPESFKYGVSAAMLGLLMFIFLIYFSRKSAKSK